MNETKNETKEEKRIRQDKEYNKMLREISYKDEGECFRNNVHFRIICREEII